MSRESSTTTTIYQTMQSGFGQLPPLDVGALRPTTTIHADGMIDSIRTLWSVTSDQRSLFEQMEKESTRRRLEAEVKANNMQSYLEGLIQQESRRRQSENEKMRADLQKAKEDTATMGEQIRSDVKTIDQGMRESLSSLSTSLRAQVLSMHESLNETRNEVSAANASALKANEGVLSCEKKLNYYADTFAKDIATLYRLIGVSKDDAQTAVARGTEKECMLQSPALLHLSRLCKGVSDKMDLLAREMAATQQTVTECVNRVGHVEQEAAKIRPLSERLSAVELDLRNCISSEDSKLLEKIIDLEKRLSMMNQRLNNAVLMPASAPNVSATSTSAMEAYDDTPLWSVVNDLRARLQDLAGQVQSRCSNERADELQNMLDQLSQRVEHLASLPATSSSDAAVTAPPAFQPHQRMYDAQALLAIKDSLTALEARVSQTEDNCKSLQANKVDRKELAAAIRDAMAAFEQALNHLYGELQKLAALASENQAGGGQGDKDATAGRFRCLSCNRDAGPLQEQIRERLSQMQFPPSNVLLGRAMGDGGSAASHAAGGRADSPIRGGDGTRPPSRAAGGAALAPHHQAVPGLKDGYGGPHMTASRRKLQNYYDSLQRAQQSRAGQATHMNAFVNGTTQPLRPEVLSTHSGGHHSAQAGGGDGPTTLSSAEAASAGPLGADGRYYVGVVSGASGGSGSAPPSASGRVRPKSAPMVRNTPIPNSVAAPPGVAATPPAMGLSVE